MPCFALYWLRPWIEYYWSVSLADIHQRFKPKSFHSDESEIFEVAMSGCLDFNQFEFGTQVTNQTQILTNLLLIFIFILAGFIKCWKPWCAYPCYIDCDAASSSDQRPQATPSQAVPRLLAVLCCDGFWSRGFWYLALWVVRGCVPDCLKVSFTAWNRSSKIRTDVQLSTAEWLCSSS